MTTDKGLENKIRIKILKKIDQALDDDNTCHAIELGKLLERI